MSVPRRLAGMAHRVRRPQTTVRWRLTLLYGGLFLISGVVLLTITYTLVDNAAVFPQGPQLSVSVRGQPLPNWQAATAALHAPPPIEKLLRTRDGRNAIRLIGSHQRVADLHQLMIESAIALGLMPLLSTALGWVMAGRVLRPLRTMTTTTQEISEENLNRRLAMSGPPDELRQLADTIDGLLARLEGAFDPSDGSWPTPRTSCAPH
ncbi:MAG: HAMP domain-containing protein [Solirubrobacteraceae bacterium]